MSNYIDIFPPDSWQEASGKISWTERDSPEWGRGGTLTPLRAGETPLTGLCVATALGGGLHLAYGISSFCEWWDWPAPHNVLNEFSSSFTLQIGMLFKPRWVRMRRTNHQIRFLAGFLWILSSFPTRYYKMYVKMSDFRFYEPVLGGQSLKVSVANYVCLNVLLKMSCHLVSFENQGPHLWSLVWELSGVDLLLIPDRPLISHVLIMTKRDYVSTLQEYQI